MAKPAKNFWQRVRVKFNRFKNSHPQIWALLKQVVLPAFAGAVVVGILIITGGAASVPFFAVIVANVGIGSFYAMTLAVVGLGVSWIGNFIADLSKSSVKPVAKVTKDKTRIDVTAKVELSEKPQTKLHFVSPSSTAFLYPIITPASFSSPVPGEMLDALPPIIPVVVQAQSKPDDSIEAKVTALAQEVIDLLDQQSNGLKRLLPTEVQDVSEFIKKYGGEYDLRGTLDRLKDLFTNPDVSYDVVLAKYNAFRELAKSEEVETLFSDKEIERAKREEAITRSDVDKNDERRAKMGLGLHPLADD